MTKRRTVRPHDNKINIPFDEALDRLVAAKPAKKKRPSLISHLDSGRPASREASAENPPDRSVAAFRTATARP